MTAEEIKLYNKLNECKIVQQQLLQAIKLIKESSGGLFDNVIATALEMVGYYEVPDSED